MSRTAPGNRPNFLRTLSRRWLLLALLPLIVGGAAYASEAINPGRYESSSSVLIQTTDLGAVLAGVPALGGEDPSRRLATEKIVASVPQIQTRALETLGVAADTALAKSVSVDVRAPESFTGGDADVIDIHVVTEDATFSRRLATAVAEAYIVFRAEVANGEITKARDQVTTRIAEIEGRPEASAEYSALVNRAEKLETLLLLGNNRARLLTEGSEPAQIAPNPLRRGVVGALLGLLLASSLAFLFDRLDRSVRDDDEIVSRVGAPILARLPDPRRLGHRGPSIALTEPGSAETEAFRLLRANLRFGLLGREGHSVGITSSLEGEGKTFVACNLAVVAAAAGAKVALVDLDLRRPSVHRVFGVERGPGLTDLLTGRTEVERALTQIEIPANLALNNGARGALSILPAGTEAPNPGEVCASIALRALLKSLEERFELVIVDTPPTSVFTDAVPIASSVSGMLCVIRRTGAQRTHLDGIRSALEGAGGAMGAVLTAAWRAPASYHTYTSDPSDPTAAEAARPASAAPRRV